MFVYDCTYKLLKIKYKKTNTLFNYNETFNK